MKEIEKRIDALEKRNPQEPIIVNVAFGNRDNIVYRVNVTENNKHEYLNKDNGEWQDTPWKGIGQ